MEDRFKGPRPPAPGPNTEIVRVSWTEPRLLICYSPAITCAYVHWFGNRSHECRGSAEICERCQQSQPRKWKGYLHVAPNSNARGFFMEITPTFEDMLAMQVPRGESLRGVIFKVSKSKGGAKGRFIVDVMERRAIESTMQVERDPMPTLRMLWARNSGTSQNESE